jgi:hypothetical protein
MCTQHSTAATETQHQTINKDVALKSKTRTTTDILPVFSGSLFIFYEPLGLSNLINVHPTQSSFKKQSRQEGGGETLAISVFVVALRHRNNTLRTIK